MVDEAGELAVGVAPVVFAVAAGPVVGAAGPLAQDAAIIDKPIKKVASADAFISLIYLFPFEVDAGLLLFSHILREPNKTVGANPHPALSLSKGRGDARSAKYC